jgi:hypothetical protein
MRIIRAVAGTMLLVIALPLLIAGAGLWETTRHRDADGAFRAVVEPVRTDGAAIVVWDLDGLLRREAAFARGGRTTLQIDVPGRFIGLGPRSEVERYLAGAGWLEIDRIRLARGRLPVDAKPVGAGLAASEGPAPAVSGDPASVASGGPAPAASGGPGGSAPVPVRLDRPEEQAFWRLHSTPERYRPLTFAPSALRGQGLALVIMNPDGTPVVAADLTVAVTPAWLDRTTWGVLMLGAVLLLLGSLAVGWPRPRRDVVYVVEPAQLPEFAVRLGLPTPAPVQRGSRSSAQQPSPDPEPARESALALAPGLVPGSALVPGAAPVAGSALVSEPTAASEPAAAMEPGSALALVPAPAPAPVPAPAPGAAIAPAATPDPCSGAVAPAVCGRMAPTSVAVAVGSSGSGRVDPVAWPVRVPGKLPVTVHLEWPPAPSSTRTAAPVPTPAPAPAPAE